MSIAEAINILESLQALANNGSKKYCYSDDDICEAIDLAINALTAFNYMEDFNQIELTLKKRREV